MVAIGAAAIGAVGSIAGGLFSSGAQSSAATKARRSQETQFVQQMNEERQRWNETQARIAPWVGAGVNALYNMEGMTREGGQWWSPRQGVDPNNYRWEGTGTIQPGDYRFNAPAQVDPGAYRFDPSQYGYTPTQALDPSQYGYTPTETGSLGRFDFKAPTVTDDPGYQFRLRQGAEALDASAAARGSMGSGAAQKALMRYGQDLGSQEYGAAYGRSWQQQQEQYERQKFMNMTEEERQRYANQTAYGRAYQQNQDIYGRGLAANQLAYGRALAGNEQDYGRAVQQQGVGFTQGLATNELAYRRAVEERALAEQQRRDIIERNYRMDLTANETGQARDWQGYAADIAERQRLWNQYASLSGLGQVGSGQLNQAGAQYGSNMAGAYQGLGTAQAAGAINQANATTGMWQGIAGGLNNAASQYMQYNMMQNMMNQQNAGRLGYNNAGQQTSGALPTSWAAYNAIPQPTYEPF